MKTHRRRLAVALLFIFVSVLSSSGLKIEAASLTATSIRFNRMQAGSDVTAVRVLFTVPASNSSTEASIVVGFPDAYTINTAGLTATGIGPNVCSAASSAVPGTLAVTGNNTNGSKGFTITGVTNMMASTSYCVDITAGTVLTNPTAGAYSVTITTRTSAPAVIDSTTIGARVITNDQIIVSAVVPPSFNFVLDGNTTSFTSNLDSGAVVQTTPRTVTITTNATGGWIAWARDSNTGLTSAAAGNTIASTTPGTAATLSAGTEGYVLGVTAADAGGGGTVTIVPAYAGGGADDNGSGLDTNFRQVASANGTANGDVITLRGKATIAALTEAGTDYTDTWTVIGAGNF